MPSGKSKNRGKSPDKASLLKQLILVGVVIAVGAIAFFKFNGPKPEGSGNPIAQVSVPDLSPQAKAGEAVYEEKCASCHGVNAAGKEGFAPPLVHIIYEPNHHGDQAFYLAAKNGVRAHHWPFGNMPPVDGITDQQIARIIEYVRELQRANGIN